MNASFGKRFAAYVVDIILLGLIVSLIWSFVPTNTHLNELENQLNDKTQECLTSEKVNYKKCIQEMGVISYKIDKEATIKNLFNFVAIILYFIIFQYFNKGRTVGKMLVGIKIEKNDNGALKLNDVAIRSLFINAIIFNMLAIICILFVNKNSYFAVVSMLSALNFLLLMVIAGMVLFRKDKRGFHDIIANTKVIETR